jgi:hypothetical protein
MGGGGAEWPGSWRCQAARLMAVPRGGATAQSKIGCWCIPDQAMSGTDLARRFTSGLHGLLEEGAWL